MTAQARRPSVDLVTIAHLYLRHYGVDEIARWLGQRPAALRERMKRAAWREALIEAGALHYVTEVGRTLRWVAEDPALPLDHAADCHVVAADLLGADDRRALQWLRCQPHPGRFVWARVRPWIRQARRDALCGPGSLRREKGLDRSLEEIPDGESASLHDLVGDLRSLVMARRVEARLEVGRLLSKAHLAPRAAEMVARVLANGGPEYGTFAAVAREMGVTPGTAKRYWADAREALRQAAG